jgi:hypothetical protein
MCRRRTASILDLRPARYRDWFTIYRKISSVADGRVRKGFQVEHRLALRHAPFTVPDGAMGRAASRVLVGGMPAREADTSLKQLKQLIER